MEREHALNRGATGLDGEMIDYPMIRQVFLSLSAAVYESHTLPQAEKILQIARAANLKIPEIE